MLSGSGATVKLPAAFRMFDKSRGVETSGAMGRISVAAFLLMDGRIQ